MILGTGLNTSHVDLSPAGAHLQSSYTPSTTINLAHICTQLHPSRRVVPKKFIQHSSRIAQGPLQPHVSSPDRFLHWMTPCGLARLHQLSQFLPRHIVAREHVFLVQAVKPNTLRNYGAGLLRFTQFCDHFNVKEALRKPTPEWLLSHFITTRGAGSISSGSLRTWLLGLELWHTVNGAPWHSTDHLKWATQGAGSHAPLAACHPKCSPVTLAHLRALRYNLNLNDTFDAAV